MYGRRHLPKELKPEEFPLRDKAEEIFILADKDHDGKLSLQELRDIMHRPTMADQAMANYLKGREDDSDKRVTLHEVCQYAGQLMYMYAHA